MPGSPASCARSSRRPTAATPYKVVANLTENASNGGDFTGPAVVDVFHGEADPNTRAWASDKCIIEHLACEQVFIGRSPDCPLTHGTDQPGWEAFGNSVLLRVHGLEYVFVYFWKVFKFTALASITTFMSPLANNDVPSPIARDSDGNVYIFGEEPPVVRAERCTPEVRALLHGVFKNGTQHYMSACILVWDGRIPKECREPLKDVNVLHDCRVSNADVHHITAPLP